MTKQKVTRMLTLGTVLSVLLIAALVLSACGAPTPAPSPTPSPKPAASPTPSPAASPKPAASPTPSPKPSPTAAAQPVKLRMSTIQQGGSFYVLGGVLSLIMTPYLPPGSSVQVDVGPGFAGNPQIINKGDAELAGCANVNAFWSQKGMEGYEPQTHVRGLNGGFGERVIVNWARKDFPYSSMREAFAKKAPVRLFIYQKGSTAYQDAFQMLALYGVTENDIKAWGGSVTYGVYETMAEYLKGNKVDLWFGGTAVKGHPTLTEVSLTTDMKFIAPEDDIIDKMVKQYGYAPAIQGGGWFKGQPDPVKTFAIQEGLIIRDTVPDDIAYALAKAIVERKDNIIQAYPSAAGLDGLKAATTAGADLHPGAAKYYKEKGFIK